MTKATAMKYKLFLTGVLILVFFRMTAQETGMNRSREKLVEKKIAFLRQRTAMNDAEFKAAQPVIRRYEMERWKLFDRRRKILASLRGDQLPGLSDSEVSGKLDAIMEIDAQLYKLRAEYYQRMREILPPRKLLQLLRAELAFKRRLLAQKRKRMAEKRQNRP